MAASLATLQLPASSPSVIARDSSAFRTADDLERTSPLGALATQNAITLPSRSVAAVVIDGTLGS